MKRHVKSGQVILFWTRDRHDILNRAMPQDAVVLRVCRGVLVVAETESGDGLAEIICCMTGDQDGTYRYEYRSKNKKGKSFDVTRLEDENGEQIKVNSFIED
ncbi:MAG: hypothetical protein KC736_02855 [Candidatus Moranbacteria bacterium]|nr:hypothetical protein [Candidatus Moranbacteria bacterium]